jgi:uncharacterized protein (TIGR04552 family)
MATPLPLTLSADFSSAKLVSLAELSLHDVEALRLILRGGSVVDWRRLNFRNKDDVDAFLRISLFDPYDPADERRLRVLLSQSVDYLRDTFRYRVADAVAHPESIQDVFLMASGVFEPDRFRRIACIVLKVMHCVHHLEARELLFQTRIAESDFQRRLEERVMGVGAQMILSGFPITTFTGNVKSRESLITKLLSKKETVAAQIYDRTRYRIVTEGPGDIVPVLHYLANHLFPFNFVIPGQSENTLVDFRDLMEGSDALRKLIPFLELDLGHERREKREREKRGEGNLFSAAGYQVLNFVVDLPVRVDDLCEPDSEGDYPHGRICFGLIEFQIVDADTNHRNEVGEASHERYKHRQKLRVLRRLSRGLVVPKRGGSA